MTPSESERRWIWREHPVFFAGMLLLMLGLLAATGVVASRVPGYQRDVALLNQQMTAEERATRDRLLAAEAKRSELAIALLRRDLRVKAMQQRGLHLAISLDDSTLYLMHGKAALRRARVWIGGDSVVRAPDGRSWRFVRPVGERRLVQKQHNPAYTVPEWVYVSRNQPVPPEAERTIRGGLGTHVMRLDDGTEIYSVPRKGPLATPEATSAPPRPKPASFMAEAKDLGAIIDAVNNDAPVFIY